MKEHVVIFNRAPLVSTDGWIHIVPKGELPNSQAKIVQILDDTALDSILAGIEKVKNRMGDKWPGIYAGREHFIYQPDQDSAALGWFKEFEKRSDGIWANEDGLTPAGTQAVKNREYKYTSFVADPSDLKKIEGKRYRVMGIETVGFTNQANGKELLTPITNRENIFAASREAADSKQNNNKGQNMKSVCTLLGLSAEADEQSVHAVVAKLMNRGEITVAELKTLREEHGAFKTQTETLLGEQVDGILAEHKITDAKIINRLKPILAPLANRAERIVCLTELLGLKPGEAVRPAATGKVLNRGAGAAVAEETVTGDEAAVKAEEDRAVKIMNRATQIVKDTPSIGLATATTMAAREIK